MMNFSKLKNSSSLSSKLKGLLALTLLGGVGFDIALNAQAQAATLTYNFSNPSQSLTGSLSFNSAAAADQLVTVSEGLTIAARFNGQNFTQANDPGANFLTSDSLGGFATGQGLGLSFIVPGVFEIASEEFTTDGFINVVPVSYSLAQPVPFEFSPVLGLGAIGALAIGGKVLKSLSKKNLA